MQIFLLEHVAALEPLDRAANLLSGIGAAMRWFVIEVVVALTQLIELAAMIGAIKDVEEDVGCGWIPLELRHLSAHECHDATEEN